MPPIDVYRVGGLHFVSDGHHWVSIAAAMGQQTIEAYVTEILTASPPKAGAALFLVPASALWALLPLVASRRLGLGSSG
jgi:hypothetical protein